MQNNQVVKAYTYGLDLISQRQSSGVSFYNYDGHGSVRNLTNSAGQITDTYDYDAFGNLIAQTGNTSNSYLYAGEQFDADLGFYYNRARYLNVQTVRFISQDNYEGSKTEPQSLHKYAYSNNNAVNRIDPSGHTSTGELAGTQLASQSITSISTLQEAALLDAVIAQTEANALLDAVIEETISRGAISGVEAIAESSAADMLIDILPLATISALIEVGYIASLGRRLPKTNGSWSGIPGDSNWLSTKSEVLEATGNEPIPFSDVSSDGYSW